MADAVVVYDVNINTQGAESTVKMLGVQIAEIGTKITSAFQVGAIGSFATESVAAYEQIADALFIVKAKHKTRVGRDGYRIPSDFSCDIEDHVC